MKELYNKFLDYDKKKNIIKGLNEINDDKEILEIFIVENDVTIFRNLLDKYQGSSNDLYFVYKEVDYQEKREIIINKLLELDDFDVILKIFILNNEVRGKYYREVNSLLVNKYFLKKKIKIKTIFYEIYQNLVDVELKEKIAKKLKEDDETIIWNLLDKYNDNPNDLYFVYKETINNEMKKVIANKLLYLNDYKTIEKIFNIDNNNNIITSFFLEKYYSNHTKLFWLYEQTEIKTIKEKIIKRLIELDAEEEINKIFDNEKSINKINHYLVDKYKSIPKRLYSLYCNIVGKPIKNQITERLIELDAEEEIIKIFDNEKSINKINHYLVDKYKSTPKSLYSLYRNIDDKRIKNKIIERLIELDAEEEINKIFDSEKTINKINHYLVDKYKSIPKSLYTLYCNLYYNIVSKPLKNKIIERLIELDAEEEINKIVNYEKGLVYYLQKVKIDKINNYLFDKYKSIPKSLYSLYCNIDCKRIKNKIIDRLIELDDQKKITKIFNKEKSIYRINKYLFDIYKSNTKKINNLYTHVDDEKLKAEIKDRLSELIKEKKSITNKIYDSNPNKLFNLYKNTNQEDLKEKIIIRLLDLDEIEIIIELFDNKNIFTIINKYDLNKQKKNNTITKKNNVFVAIDFETANNYRNSACSVALVRVESGKIVFKEQRLIRPPDSYFCFSYLHGINWEMVKSEPTFRVVWKSLEHILDGADFFVAHYASFDKSVLKTCCEESNIPFPSIPFKDTVMISRKTWNIRPTKLPDVCDYLNIDLDHHDALSDAVACAKIMIESLKR